MTLGGGKCGCMEEKWGGVSKKSQKMIVMIFFHENRFSFFFLNFTAQITFHLHLFIFIFSFSHFYTSFFLPSFVTCWLIKSFLFLFCYMLTKKIWYILHEKEVDCMHTMPTNHLTSIWWESSVSHYPSCMPKD